MMKISEAKAKEVINVANGQRLGYIHDFEIDLDRGKIVAMILSSNTTGLNFFSKSNDIVIAWDEIEKMGIDIILVNF